MLSGAKHLLFLVESKQKQIPRLARDDIGGLFISPLDSAIVVFAAAAQFH
jgi:hypothetical protein